MILYKNERRPSYPLLLVGEIRPFFDMISNPEVEERWNDFISQIYPYQVARKSPPPFIEKSFLDYITSVITTRPDSLVFREKYLNISIELNTYKNINRNLIIHNIRNNRGIISLCVCFPHNGLNEYISSRYFKVLEGIDESLVVDALLSNYSKFITAGCEMSEIFITKKYYETI